jgi:hypothetical protein
MMESHVDFLIKEKENVPISKTTMSMVTVRLSDTTLGSLPSPTPTLKLVDDNAEEFPLNGEPMYAPERTESPSPEEMSASRRSSTDSQGSQNGVDWEELERNEGESIKDETSEEVGPLVSYPFLLFLMLNSFRGLLFFLRDWNRKINDSRRILKRYTFILNNHLLSLN